MLDSSERQRNRRDALRKIVLLPAAALTGLMIGENSTRRPVYGAGPNNTFPVSGPAGIGTSSPDASLEVVCNTTENNTAHFSNPAIGPNDSHIHYGTRGDWYIRSASNAGHVIIQVRSHH